MRNLLFVLVFISITVLGCEGNKSPLENCADTKFKKFNTKKDFEFKNTTVVEFFKKSYKEKMQFYWYEHYNIECEQERKFAPKTFKVKWQ